VSGWLLALTTYSQPVVAEHLLVVAQVALTTTLVATGVRRQVGCVAASYNNHEAASNQC
jgi:hypothetical protein